MPASLEEGLLTVKPSEGAVAAGKSAARMPSLPKMNGLNFKDSWGGGSRGHERVPTGGSMGSPMSPRSGGAGSSSGGKERERVRTPRSPNPLAMHSPKA